jgi:ethanolamine utilization protein EutN
MRIARIVGTVTLNRRHESFGGAVLKLVRPLSLSDLAGQTQPEAEELVIWDQLGAGQGELIALSEGAEAAQPFRPDVKPVDAYCAAILDSLEITTS